jgi:predicted nucleic acid-binding Zn ribbon protein
MKRVNYMPLGDLLKLFIKEYGLEQGLERTRIFVAWDKAVGEKYAMMTTNKFFKNGKLYCSINSSAAKTQLFINRESIKKMINAELENDVVEEIILK